jgi:hypothetical protein
MPAKRQEIDSVWIDGIIYFLNGQDRSPLLRLASRAAWKRFSIFGVAQWHI